MRRTPLSRGTTPLRRKTPLRKSAGLPSRSVMQWKPRPTPKRATSNPDTGFPEAVKEIVRKRSGGVCELDGCDPGPQPHHHHRRPRGRGGSSVGWVNAASNCLLLSPACHLGHVETNRQFARERGWLVPLNGTRLPSQVTVVWFDHRRGRTVEVFLCDDGSVVEVG